MIYIHIDLDNLWMYENEFGIKINQKKDYIYSHSLPLFLELLKKYNSKATFMLIGQDLTMAACQSFCRRAISAGHEIANHTWSHPISFNKLSYEQKKQQIVKAHKEITKVCGKEPVGFRGPGYYQDSDIISILKKLNYTYDSSVLPGFAQVLMSAYANARGGENRHKTFGRQDYIMKSSRPYLYTIPDPNKKLLELPISVLPILRLPIHTTFAYFLGSLYRQLIITYLKSKPDYMLYLFHAIDFIDVAKENNHPIIAFRYSYNERMNFIEQVVKSLVQTNGRGLRTSSDILTANPHPHQLLRP